MTEDIRSLLDEASAESARPLLDTDLVVTRGRGRVRRRRFALLGGTAAVVAAVTAVAIAGAGALPQEMTQAADTPTPSAVPPPDYTLPALDPDRDYGWYSDGRTDDATAAQLTTALTAYFAEHYPDAKVARWGPEKEDLDDEGNFSYVRNLAELTEDQSTFQVARYTHQLRDLDTEPTSETGPEVVYEAPVYRLWNGGDIEADRDSTHTIGTMTGTPLALDGEGADQLDELQVVLLPPGGYRTGHDADDDGIGNPTNGYLLEGCDGYDLSGAHGDGGREVDFECDEEQGPGGERILTVAARETYRSNGAVTALNTVVVIRADGSALVVADAPTTGMEFQQGRGDGPGEPTLGIDELTALALAVPMVPFGQ